MIIDIKRTETGYVVLKRKYFLFIPIGWEIIYKTTNKEELKSYLNELVKENRPKDDIRK